jgi:hypothetical protein
MTATTSMETILGREHLAHRLSNPPSKVGQFLLAKTAAPPAGVGQFLVAKEGQFMMANNTSGAQPSVRAGRSDWSRKSADRRRVPPRGGIATASNSSSGRTAD